MTTTHKNAISWIPKEVQYASQKLFPENIMAEDKAMIARLKNSNYRLAEAILADEFKSGKDFFQLIRTKISRGNLDEAEIILNEYLISQKQFDETLLPDTLLELSRVYYHKAKWSESLRVINLAFTKSDVSGITRITLLQMRTVTLYELGHFEKCISDLEEIRSLSLLFPHSQATFYADALLAKVLVRKGTLKSGEEYLNRMVKKYLFKNEDSIPDKALTLLRIKIDLLRLQNKPYALYALSCKAIADAMGDELYKGLAILDLAYCENKQLASEALAELSEYRKKFEKINDMMHEIESNDKHSTTVASIFNYSRHLLNNNNRTTKTRPQSINSSDLKEIIFLDAQIKLDLNTLECVPTNLQSQSALILTLIQNEEMNRESLFEKVWGLKFQPETHDITLRNAISRARKQSNLKIECSQQKVKLSHSLIIQLSI